MVDFVIGGKGRDREKRDETKAEIQRSEWFRAPRRSASSDGSARCSSHTRAQHQSRMTTRTRSEKTAYLEHAGWAWNQWSAENKPLRTVSEEDAKEHDDRTDLESDRVQRGGRRTPGEDDGQEDPVQGFRDDVARGLDDGWSQGSQTVPVETALVCSTPE